MAEKRLAPGSRKLYLGGVRNVAVSFAGLLDEGETLSGTPTVSEATESLGITAAQVSTADLVIEGVKVKAGHAVQFRLTRGEASAGNYEIDILAPTSAGQTIPGSVTIRCV
jgi:hypothetical protein